MRTFFTVWLLAAVAQGRFNSESPSLINRIVTQGDSNVATKGILLPDQLSESHEYQDSIVCVSLNMKGDKLENKAVETISNIAETKNTKLISLKNCRVHSDALSTVMSSILWRTGVSCLVVHNCRLNSDILSSILDAGYSSSSSPILSLSSEENDEEVSETKNRENVIDKKIAKKTGYNLNNDLSLLDVSFNNLDSAGIKQLSTVIKRCTNLQILALDGNKMKLEDLQTVLEIVRSHPSLVHLSLSDCGLTDESMEHLNFMLKMNRNITCLDLSLNKLSSEGLYVFSEGLMAGGGSKLESIDISYNRIGDIGVSSLARAVSMSRLPALKHLIMKEVDATAISLEKLFHSFSYGSLLETIDVSGNTLIPSNKAKKIKAGYSPKNLQKKLLSYTPQIKNALTSFSTVLSSHIKTAGEMAGELLEKKNSITVKNVKKSKNGKNNKNSKKNVKIKASTGKKILGSKEGKKLVTKTDLNQEKKEMKSKKLLNKKKSVPVRSVENSKKSKKLGKSGLTVLTKNIILSEDKLLERSRLKAIRGVLHTVKMARNLKKISLAKVGLSDFSCALFRQEHVKKEKMNLLGKNKELVGKREVSSDSGGNGGKKNEKKMRKSIVDKKLRKSKNSYKYSKNDLTNISLSPQIDIPTAPELIMNLNDGIESEKDIDSTLYRHLRPDNEENISENVEKNKDSEDEKIKIITIENAEEKEEKKEKRDIRVVTYLNEISVKSAIDLTELFQLS